MTGKKHKPTRKVWSWRDVVKVLLKVVTVLPIKGAVILLLFQSAHHRKKELSLSKYPDNHELKPGTFNSIIARANLSRAEFFALAN